jgi:hypothetical protein
MIYEERFGKLSIFSSIFGKIENLEFSGLPVFYKKLKIRPKNRFVPNFSSQIIF